MRKREWEINSAERARSGVARSEAMRTDTRDSVGPKGQYKRSGRQPGGGRNERLSLLPPAPPTEAEPMPILEPCATGSAAGLPGQQSEAKQSKRSRSNAKVA